MVLGKFAVASGFLGAMESLSPGETLVVKPAPKSDPNAALFSSFLSPSPVLAGCPNRLVAPPNREPV